MFCSTVIPTVARASLARSVQSVLDQSLRSDEFEIIVVNDSGQPLAEAAWQHSPRVTLLNTQRRERSTARNTGAAIATGRYLHFLDDDDWLLPGAFEALWQLSQISDAAWLYGTARLVDSAGQHLLDLRHALSGNLFIQVMAGEWIPLQASLIRADAFFASGGFNPLMPVSQDVDLSRRIALRGDFAESSAVVACIRRGVDTSTTDYARLPFYSRRARELILNEPGVFVRLRASANSSYWCGRLVRVYLTSLVWNVRQRRVLTAVSRMAFGMTGGGMSVRHWLARDFWRAILYNHQSETFKRGFDQAKRSNPAGDGTIGADG